MQKMTHDIICLGGSAGGLEAVRRIIRAWKAPIPAAVFVVIHWPSDVRSALPEILERTDSLPAQHPADGDQVEHSRIYAAPPDNHLLLEDGRMRLSRGPKENLVRPSVDALFRSAAKSYGPRVVGVVLSGNLDDGTAGLLSIKQAGGVTMAQDPEEAAFRGMPLSAIETGAVDRVMTVEGIADELWRLAVTPVQLTSSRKTEDSDAEIIGQTIKAQEDGKREGGTSTIVCPDCGGVLWELRDGNLVRYRCHTGHTFSPASLAQGISDKTEDAIWTAVRALQEKAMIHRRMAKFPPTRRSPESVAESQREAEEAEKCANALLDLLGRIPK